MEELLIPHNTIIPSDIKSFLGNHNNVISKLKSGGKNEISLSDKLCIYRINDRQEYLLFKIEKQDNIVLYIFRTCLNYNDYKKFRSIKDVNIQLNYCKSETEDDEVKAKFAELKPSVLVKEMLPDSMRVFESERDFSNINQSYIFEMEEWITSTKKIEKYPIFKTLQNIVANHQEANFGNGWFYLDIEDMSCHKILFRYKENANNTHYYLFKVTDDIPKAISEIEKKNTYNGELLLKSAVRGYPDWIMYGDYESWSNIENDKKANLALSDEEVRVLNTAHYPFFINGLAGSGKSTILYYLFANVFASDKQKERDFLFLSYSKNLTEEAKNIMVSLYCSNPHINRGQKITKEQRQEIDNLFAQYFKTFQEFIKENFLDDDEKKIFSTAKHLNYDKFQLYYRTKCNLQNKLQDKPMVVWSVIRTFIKGRKSDKYITSNDYAQIERDDRTVTIEDFRIIEDIFNKWYSKCLEKGEYWDDLDLIRYILNNKTITPEFDIIFCDEAQDFTPIENQLILSMSKYSKYDLSDFRQIPIAYAGDPNQAVSPTGFNWDRLKDIFNKSFKEQIGDYMALDIQPLKNNYRSKKAVVQFANSLQYIRKCFLAKEKLEPQSLWNPIGNISPLFYYEEDIEDILVKGFDKTASIITGDDDEEAYKKDKNSLLLKVYNQEKIHTAITAKGLEAEAVILYRMGDKMPDAFSKICQNQVVELDSDRYECMHFLTKLYIAVSRAKKILYIIDTKPNYDKLWYHFIDNKFINKTLLPSNSKDIDVWGKKDSNGDLPMGGISLGRREEFIQKLEENYKPEEIAEDIFKKAYDNEDAREMKRAAGYFDEASNIPKAKESEAYYHLFNQDYKNAGDLFSEISMSQEAAKAYWKGECWDELTQCEDRIKRTLSLYYKDEKTLIDLLKIEDLATNFDILSDAYNDIAIKISKEVEKFDNKSYLHNLNEFISELSKKGFKFLDEGRALLSYKNGEYAKAIDIWDSLTEMKFSNEYYQAQVHEAKNHNDKIYWMNKGGKRTEILDKYSDISAIDTYNLNDQSKRIVCILLAKDIERFDDALNYPYNGKDKYDLLYENNPLQLIDKYVLDDYNESKFEQYIESKIKKSETSIFDEPLSVDFFEKIFNLEKGSKKAIWIDFLKLRDKNKKRVLLKNKENVKFIFEVLVAKIRKNNNIYLASCFMEMLFDIDYSYERASQYYKIILNIFDGKNYFFSRRDLDISSKRNVYFTQCGFDKNKLNNIKGNLLDFVTETLNDNELRIKQPEVKVLYRIIEKTSNFESTDEMYQSGLENEDLFPLYDFFNTRIAVNMLYSDIEDAMEDFIDELDVNNISIKTAIDTFDQDDTVAYIRKAVEVKDTLSTDQIITIAELLYKNQNLNGKDIKSNQQDDSVIIALDKLFTKEIDEQEDVYSQKLLYFALEKLYSEDDKTITKKFDGYINNKILKSNTEVTNFLKERALCHWYRIDTKKAKEKKAEYKYNGKMDRIKEYPSIYPSANTNINESSANTPELITSNKEIGGILIVPNKKKIRVQFRKDSDDIFEIEDGKIEIENEDLAQQNGQTVTIGNDFVVTVVSETVINIESQNKKYVVDFERMD